MEGDSMDTALVDQTGEDSIRGEKPFEFGIRMEIDNFSKIPIDEKILSPPCVVHNLAWRIMIRRTEQSGKSRLGYFLVCDPDASKVIGSWSCEATARLYIMNREDPIDHFTREIRHLFCSKENDWGFTTFCYWDYICDPRNKYISNDSVKFDVCIVVDRPEGVDMSHDSFFLMKNFPRRMLKERKTGIKNENQDALKAAIKRLKYDVMNDMGALATSVQSEMRTLKSDLLKTVADQLKAGLNEIKLLNLAKTASENSANHVRPESKFGTDGPRPLLVPIIPQVTPEYVVAASKMSSGSTVHWFGPSQRLSESEDDEIENQLVKLSIEEQKKVDGTSSEDERNVSNDTNEKKRKVEKTVEQNANDEVKKNKKTAAESPVDDYAETSSDISSDDFEIISLDEGDSLLGAGSPTSNVSSEAVSKNAFENPNSFYIKNCSRTGEVYAITMQNDSGISNETINKTAADHPSLDLMY